MEIAIVGNEHFVTGFHLAGVKKAFVVEESATTTFQKALSDETIGLLIMDDEQFNKLDEKSQSIALTSVKPTVIVLSHDVSAEKSLRDMIIRALGIDLWANEKKEDA